MNVFIRMSISGGLLIALIGAVRLLAARRLPNNAFRLFWGVALARLLIPYELPARFSVYTLLARLAQGKAPASIPAVPPFHGMEAGAGAAEPDTAVNVLAILWIAGTALRAAWFLTAYVRCRLKFRESLPVEDARAAAWLSAHGGARRIQIRRADCITVPLTYGIIRPVILLPKQMDLTDEVRLRCVLEHEYAHIRRLDGVGKFLLAAALCVHWFNPFVWGMYFGAGRDMEISCDETAIRALGEKFRAAYVRVLLDVEENRGVFSPFGNSFGKNALEERVEAIMKQKRGTVLGVLCSCVLAAGIVAVFATTAMKETSGGGDPIERLKNSITYSDGSMQFTVPDGYDGQWNILVAGRVMVPQMKNIYMGMSVHYLEEESAAGSWTAGSTYSFGVSSGGYDELSLSAILAEREGEETIDLTTYLPQELLAP